MCFAWYFVSCLEVQLLRWFQLGHNKPAAGDAHRGKQKDAPESTAVREVGLLIFTPLKQRRGSRFQDGDGGSRGRPILPAADRRSSVDPLARSDTSGSTTSTSTQTVDSHQRTSTTSGSTTSTSACCREREVGRGEWCNLHVDITLRLPPEQEHTTASRFSPRVRGTAASLQRPLGRLGRLHVEWLYRDRETTDRPRPPLTFCSLFAMFAKGREAWTGSGGFLLSSVVLWEYNSTGNHPIDCDLV